MSNNQSYILSLCQQLHQAGKQPTMGMIRTKANRPLALPEIIQVLKNWKADPELANQEIIEQQPEVAQPTPDLAQRVTALEQQVARLEAQIAAMVK